MMLICRSVADFRLGTIGAVGGGKKFAPPYASCTVLMHDSLQEYEAFIYLYSTGISF